MDFPKDLMIRPNELKFVFPDEFPVKMTEH
jgi:hypothetical protein